MEKTPKKLLLPLPPSPGSRVRWQRSNRALVMSKIALTLGCVKALWPAICKGWAVPKGNRKGKKNTPEIRWRTLKCLSRHNKTVLDWFWKKPSKIDSKVCVDKTRAYTPRFDAIYLREGVLRTVQN